MRSVRYRAQAYAKTGLWIGAWLPLASCSVLLSPQKRLSHSSFSRQRHLDPNDIVSRRQTRQIAGNATGRFDASTSALEPGQKFHLILELTIDSNYWVPGPLARDFGEAPQLEVNAPEGFQIGASLFPATNFPATQFPGKKGIELTSDNSPWGYQNLTAVFIPITCPSELTPDKHYRFQLSGRWSVCRRNHCESYTAQGLILVGSSEHPLAPAFSPELEDLFLSIPTHRAEPL